MLTRSKYNLGSNLRLAATVNAVEKIMITVCDAGYTI